MRFKVLKEILTTPWFVHICWFKIFVEVSLTKTEKNQRHLCECCIWGGEVEFSFGPSQSVQVEPGQYIVPAQGFRLGHQFLLSQRAVKHIQDLCSKHRGPPQDLHVLLQGIWVRECLTSSDQLCLGVSSLYPGGTKLDDVASVGKENPYLEAADQFSSHVLIL